MATKLIKISTRAVIVILLATMINIAIFFTWIATGPRSIPFLSGHIERALNKTSPGYRIKIGQAVFVWDNWSSPLAVHVKNVKLFDKDTAPLANFPEVKIGLSISHLLIGDVVVRDLGISSPRFRIALSEKPEPVSGQPKDNILPDLTPAVKHLSNVLQKSTSLTFENVNIQQATIVFDTGHQELPWFIEEAYIELSPSKTRPELNIEARTLLAQYPIFFTASSKLVDADAIELILSTKGLPSKILPDFLPQYSWLQDVNLALDVSIDAALNKTQGLKSANYHVTSKKGAMALETQGWLKSHAQYDGVYNVPETAFIARLSNLPFDDLWRYWRPGFADNPRKWMSEHMQGGTVTQATLNFTATPGVFLGDALAPEAISANVTIEDVDVTYHPRLPLLESTTGSALFTGNSMDLAIEKSTLLNSQLTSNVVITGLSEGKQNMTINGRMSGPVSDLSHFYTLRKKRAEEEEASGVTAENLTGDAETSFFLEFPLLNTLAVDDVTLAINGELQNVALPNAAKGMDLTEGTLTLMVNNTTLSAEGDAKLNGAPITLTYIEDAREEFDSQIQLDATLTPADLARFGAKGVEITGLLKVNGTIENTGTTTHATTTINAISAGLALPALGWEKQRNLPLEITLAIHDTADAYTLALRDIAITGQDIDIKGDLTVKKDGFSIVDGTLSPFKLNKHDLAIAIASKDAIPTYTITGAQLNAEPVIDYLSKGEEVEKKEAATRKPLHIRTDINTALLANDVKLTDVKGFLECNTEKCHQAGLLGKFAPEEDVFIDLKTNDKTRTFFLKTTNAGSFFRGLGLLKHINGGTFETTATMDDGSAPSGTPPAKGSFIMKDFRVKKAPILTKLLTLLSFTGILDLLEGEGIFFKKAAGRYVLDFPTLTVQEVKASGNSLGLTIDGEANLGTSDVLLRGNVVPAYSLNTFIEGIPFLGEMITGGEGEGIVAARYKISGKYQDPEITVNPLSILTPGFLRNIWGDTAVPEPNPELDMQQPRPE